MVETWNAIESISPSSTCTGLLTFCSFFHLVKKITKSPIQCERSYGKSLIRKNQYWTEFATNRFIQALPTCHNKKISSHLKFNLVFLFLIKILNDFTWNVTTLWYVFNSLLEMQVQYICAKSKNVSRPLTSQNVMSINLKMTNYILYTCFCNVQQCLEWKWTEHKTDTTQRAFYVKVCLFFFFYPCWLLLLDDPDVDDLNS